MAYKTFRFRSFHGALAAVLAAHCGSAAALEFQIFDTDVKVDNLLTIGASWRTQDRDPSLIGKSSLHRMNNPITNGAANPGTAGHPSALCYSRQGDNGSTAPARDTSTTGDGGTIQLWRGVIPEGCSTSSTTQTNGRTPIQHFVAAPGSFDPNGDDGNMNFDKYDMVHAIAKFTSDISFSVAEFNVFVRPIVYFDANYTDFTTNYADSALRDSHVELLPTAEDRVGFSAQLLDYNVSHLFTVFDHDINIKAGNQVLNWGESSLLVFNSLNTINPLDATKVRFPGADLKEFFRPVGLVVMGTDLIENVSLEGWYQYEWKSIIIDPPGTFFSQSDILGGEFLEGGAWAQNGQGREPEDPDALFRGIDTCGSDADTPAQCFSLIGTLGSTSSRIVRRNFEEESRRAPDDTGQYGLKLQLFLEDFNNGTELAFYYANYHSRLPIQSAIAATVRSCIVNAASLGPGGECGYQGPGTDADNATTTNVNEEPLPVDTLSVFFEYPQNIQLYGVSFNTTVGDWALSGEYAHRPNLPTQVHSLDLSLAALGPSFPDAPVFLGANTLYQRYAFPDFVSVYRGLSGGYNNGDYIRGWEELETGQANLTFLRLIGGDNPIGASQMTILFETGMNRVYNMPPIHELQFQGGGTVTPISSGADGSRGINPRDLRCPVATPNCANVNDPTAQDPNWVVQSRQNATAHKDLKGFGSSESYGYRLLNLNRWDSALFGANIETLTIVQHDVKGTTPGIGTNFIHGRKQIAFGVRFDYLATWIGEVRYSWFTGGAKRDALRDRDNIFVTLGYQF